MQHPLPVSYVRELLSYDPGSGVFTWRRRELRPGQKRLDSAWNTRFAGKPVKPYPDYKGYPYFSLHCRKYKAHRIAWAIYHGEWPPGDLDHINGNRADFKINNLRPATQSENNCNSRLRKDNTSGAKGVSWNKQDQRWAAYISMNGKTTALGKYHQLEHAIAARRLAEEVFHGEYARAV